MTIYVPEGEESGPCFREPVKAAGSGALLDAAQDHCIAGGDEAQRAGGQAPEAAPDGFRDTLRLDFLVTMGARVSLWYDGGWRVCRSKCGRVRWHGQPSPNPRAAIDSAIAEGDSGKR